MVQYYTNRRRMIQGDHNATSEWAGFAMVYAVFTAPPRKMPYDLLDQSKEEGGAKDTIRRLFIAPQIIHSKVSVGWPKLSVRRQMTTKNRSPSHSW